MRRCPAPNLSVLALAALVSAQCTSASGGLQLQRPTGPPATQLADVRLPDGTECIVRLSSGETVRGRLEGMTTDHLVVQTPDADAAPSRRRIAHDDVAVLARIVKMSKGNRGWLGTAIGAAVSVPFGISMVGDMVVPAALVGALIGRRTGDSRAEIVFERQPQPQ